ncbi:MAG: hypothetical protein A2X94_15805 [Bdellovibrionales bacterium GWB1_55_8]|nr:MAG: hypothetical protein A2X94_15805 [Bdellovibrionales bacterium GWB1_55_8]
MRKVNGLAMGMAAFLAMGLAANSVKAEERLLSSNFSREFRGEQVIDLGYELRFSGMRGLLNSVIVIASSDAGRGHVELVIDGRTIDRRILGRTLESIQFNVGRELYPQIRDVRLHFKGNVNLAFFAAALDDGFGNGGGHRPDPRPVPRPNPRPDPRPDPRPVPHPVPGPQMLSQAEFDGFMRELQIRAFDSDKQLIVNQYVNFWSNRLMSMHQLGATLGQFRFDDGRLGALRSLRRIVVVDTVLMNTVLSKFDFDSNREQARRILLSR